MLQFFSARMLETEDFAALRVDAAQDVADCAVLSGGVHALENKQRRITVGRIEEALQAAQLPDVRGEELLVNALGLVERFVPVAHFPRSSFLPTGTRNL